MRSLKILSVLLLSLGLVVATGEGTLVAAADSHATHFVSDIGPHLDQDEGGCTTCHAAGNFQCDPGGPLFADDKHLETTEVCNPCHSPGGAFAGANGLDDPDIGAKANWAEGVYVVIPDWCQNTSYRIDDIVKYNDTVYRCLVGFTSGTSFVESNWESIGPWRGAWQPNTAYLTNDVVKYDVRAYRCLADVTSGGDFVESNWEVVALQTLESGKEKWCATCHDDDPAYSKADKDDQSGVYAPNVIGDSSQAYGYYVEQSGHGRPSANLKCEECHDLTRPHIDHEPRTYEVREYPPPPDATDHPYLESYRLNGRLDVPRMSHQEGEFQLCLQCHPEVFGPENYFRYDRTPEPTLLHHAHTVFSYPHMMWDSDYDGVYIGGRTGDSTASCPTCHNVHGSPMDLDPDVGGETDLHPNPAMIRHGELLGGSELNGLRFLWYTEVGGSTGTGEPTTDRLLSKSGELWTNPPSCGQPVPCHSSQPHYNRASVPDIIIDDFEAYTNDAGLQAVWDNSRDAKAPRLEPQSTGATGPDESQCMRVRIKWARTTYDHGTLVREYDPYIDATGMGFFSFYVKINNNAKIERIQVRLKKYGSTVCIANFYTSELENGVWKRVSIPRSSFSDTTWGKLSEIRFRIYEYNPSSNYTHDVYFDDIKFTGSE